MIARSHPIAPSVVLAAALTAAVAAVFAFAPPAAAACHIAAFEDTTVQGGEASGSVTLTVELVGGQPSCSGSVRYATENGTATAPADYTARSGELTFVAGDDRRETISIPIANDTTDEPNETFRVRLSEGSQPGLTPSDTPATVTIVDNDQPAATPTQTQTRRASPSPTATPAASPTQTRSPASSPTPTPAATDTAPASPSPTGAGSPLAAQPGDDGGINVGLVGGLLGGLAAAGAASWYWLVRRRPAE